VIGCLFVTYESPQQRFVLNYIMRHVYSTVFISDLLKKIVLIYERKICSRDRMPLVSAILWLLPQD
jgi:hypothetical protein